MSLKLITNHKDYPLLLVDTEAKIIKGSYFLLRDKHINRYEGSSEERYKTHLSEPIIAASPKLGGLPLLPSISEKVIECTCGNVPDRHSCRYYNYENKCTREIELPKSDPLGRRKPVYMTRNTKAGKEGNLTIDVQLFEDLQEAINWCEGKSHLNVVTQWIVSKELPKQEEDIESKARQLAIDRKWNPNSMETRRVAREIINAYKEGYKAASKKWTDEDMIRFGAFMQDRHVNPSESFEYFKSKFLSPTLTPIEFIPEYEEKWENQYTGIGDGRSYQPILKLKIVSGVLQGTYKFEE